MDDLLEGALIEVLLVVLHPASFFWAPGLVLSIVAALVWFRVSERVPLSDLARRLLPRDPRYGRELPVDVALAITNSVLSMAVNLVLSAIIVFPVTGALAALAGVPGEGQALSTAGLLAVAFAAWAVGDYALYWIHRVFHEVPVLWRLHAVHHQPEVLTPVTAYRFHPLDQLASVLANGLAIGSVLAVCAVVTGQQTPGYQVFGVNIFYWTWKTLLAPLRHTHVPLPYPRGLSHVLMSPVMHQVHHSSDPAHRDRNYATGLSLWDWIHGTLVIPDSKPSLSFGLTRTGAEAPSVAVS